MIHICQPYMAIRAEPSLPPLPLTHPLTLTLTASLLPPHPSDCPSDWIRDRQAESAAAAAAPTPPPSSCFIPPLPLLILLYFSSPSAAPSTHPPHPPPPSSESLPVSIHGQSGLESTDGCELVRCLCRQKQFLLLLVLSSTQRKNGLTSSISKPSHPGRSSCLLFQLLSTLFPLEQGPSRLLSKQGWSSPSHQTFFSSITTSLSRGLRYHHSQQQLRLLRTLVLFLSDSYF